MEALCESGVPVDIPDDCIQYILNVGAFLQRISWSRSSTYGDICHQYTEYVARKYKDAIVVLIAMKNMNAKNTTHQGWSTALKE